MRIACLLLVLAAACSGDQVDHGTATCSGALYDLCANEHGCSSERCLVFGDVQACTQACDETTPCPDDDEGNPVTCTDNLCIVVNPRVCVER